MIAERNSSPLEIVLLGIHFQELAVVAQFPPTDYGNISWTLKARAIAFWTKFVVMELVPLDDENMYDIKHVHVSQPSELKNLLSTEKE